ncbi:MAG: hypothetical protein A2849_01820 [Candidatus Taylorbacteria bacterium RIFCSPHIGHO2_01_FULL_51_15]|uniref:AB hydrolase-1 domain-containing protein n=1 Tax=Candidatus Taylorbacteria bacterium RIFCSPHIGHO2_01_FULL_51_15 TaxID=1802304 RepID=A0A1G2MAT3_9BACT|nr:MAG: hypothetical protein A2849_01820 [Candidatus Taylorbacteria bacterium RIFCSPHIGHO2_01_FULL_51_15]
MQIFRTKFKKDILAEFILPFRPSNRVIILCKGMPGMPRFPDVLKFWARKGFWVFFPRYRGTWESGGEFLRESPEKDILDVIDELPKGFTDLWSGKRYKLPSADCEIYLLGGSFGGPAAILCSRDPRVRKAVAFAPVIDWKAPSDEPMGKLGAFLPKGFGNSYRFSKKNWRRLSENKFYSPISLIPSLRSSPAGGELPKGEGWEPRGSASPPARARTIKTGKEGCPVFALPRNRLRGTGGDGVVGVDGSKLLIFHAKDDRSVPYSYTKRFAAKTGAKLITLQTGGHFGFSKSIEPRIYEHIRNFFRQKKG